MRRYRLPRACVDHLHAAINRLNALHDDRIGVQSCTCSLGTLIQEGSQDESSAAEKITRPRKRPHVQLPWMKVPATYAHSDAVQVSDVKGMRSKLRRALSSIGHTTLFPVQAVAWELLGGGLSSRHDLCINAPTGSGKTLAYTLPLIQKCLTEPRVNGMRALVIVPTRALATQV